jgi:Transposase DDE domain
MSRIEEERQLVDIETLFTLVYLIVDDWVNQHPRHRVGRKASFSDSEGLTLVLMMDFIPYPSERQYLAFIRANYLPLFPKLLDQSQFNVRARGLRYSLEQLRTSWLKRLLPELLECLLLDTKPVPVLSYKRNKAHSDFLGSATYGVCVSRKLKYFGYKFVLLCSLQGDSIYYELVPANTDERDATEQVFQRCQPLDILADKGFISESWQAEQSNQGIYVWTAKRDNQAQQNPAAFDAMIASYRQRIEGVFNELQNLGRNLERLFAKTVVGLCTRVAALVASHTLKTFLRRFHAVDVQTFAWLA